MFMLINNQNVVKALKAYHNKNPNKRKIKYKNKVYESVTLFYKDMGYDRGSFQKKLVKNNFNVKKLIVAYLSIKKRK